MRRAIRMRSALIGRLQLVQAFRSRSFTLLWSGQTVSVLGDAVFTIAITWEVLLLTGSSTAMSLILLAQWAPRILFLPLGGLLADRVSRRFLMLFADAGRGIIVLLVAWLGWSHQLQFWHLVALAPLFGIVSSFFDPAYQAIMPQLVETEALGSVNSLNTLSRNLGFLLGPVPGAICAALAGMPAAFAFDGLTYFVSALCLLALHLPPVSKTKKSSQVEDTHKQPSQGFRGALHDIRDGMRYVLSVPWLWMTALAAPLVGIGITGAMWVSLPRLVRDVYLAGIWLIGAVATADAIGSIIAAILVGNAQATRRGVVAYTAVLMSGLALLFCALPLPRPLEPFIIIVASGVIGAGISTFTILWGTLQQEKVPNHMLGRVSSITQLGIAATLPAGLVVAGLLSDHLGPAQVFGLAGILVVIPALIGLCMPDIRHL